MSFSEILLSNICGISRRKTSISFELKIRCKIDDSPINCHSKFKEYDYNIKVESYDYELIIA